ncbi:uncharacterized protein LOC134230665 [Saccostrea cucullata]|uniref:uncharacterized protein LOC134230665 n=1 Tax=Saccostrea cuccullata TaxID=36930 RepID=UPI002ECFC5E8
MACAEYPTFCEICKKGPFAGVIPAQQHFRSQAHISKKSQQTPPIQQTQTYVSACNACGKKFNNELSAEQHFASENHKKKEALLQKSTAQNYNSSNSATSDMELDSPSLELSLYPSENLVNIQPKTREQTAFSQNPVKYQRRTEYVFDENDCRGFCNVCNIDLTSRQHANQHLSGQKHLKAKQIWNNNIQGEKTLSCLNATPSSPGQQNKPDCQSSRGPPEEYSFDGNQGYCHVCKIELTSMQHAQQHINGKPHAKAKAAQNLGINQINPDIGKLSPTSNRTVGQNHEYDFSGGRGYCHLCKIELTSKAHAEQHLSGKSHEKAKMKGNIGIPSSLPLTCEICVKTFSGPECASQHFSSVKHRQREALSQSQKPNSPILNQTIPGIVAPSNDRTHWELCEVCNVRLNSLEQLNIHKNSPKHKAEEEKQARMGNKVEVTKTPEFKMHAISPRVQVQDTGFCPVNPRVNFADQTKGNVEIPLASSFGPQSFLSNQPGMFAQEQRVEEVEDLKLATLPSLNPSSMLNDTGQPSNLKEDNIDETLPKEVKFEKPDIPADIDEEKNFKEKYVEKELEKELINEKINTSSSSLSSLEMPALEKSDVRTGMKSNRDTAMKNDKDLKNLQRQMADKPRAPGSYPYESKQPSYYKGESKLPSDEKSYSSIGNLNQISSQQNVTNSGISNLCKKETGHQLSTSRDSSSTEGSPGNSAERDLKVNSGMSRECGIQSNTTPKAQNSRSSGSALVTRVPTTRSGGRARSEGTAVPLYGSSDSSDESDTEEEEDGKFFPCTSSDVNKKLQELGVSDSSNTPANYTPVAMNNKVVNPYRATHKYYCHTCQRPMNSKKALKDHMEGRGHMQKVAVLAAVQRSHRPIVKEVLDQGKTDCNLTALTPRSYQRELYGRAMEGDRVVFLPTGTGKTLIACMAISAMLELNPTRQALFLVDKVLLVIQQSRNLISQLGDRLYTRFDPENPSKLMERKLKIAALCGGQQSTDGVPIWQHDLIVVTAAYCEQLIMRNVLRWEDLCIVVLDEAHHCVKSHPFKKQLENNHLTMSVAERPKILGLTASPAGKKTFPMTVNLLNELMESMGGAKIAVTKECKAELEKFQSSAELIVNYKPMSIKEQKFQKELQLYLLQCYIRLSAETNILEQCDLEVLPGHCNISEEKKSIVAKNLHGDILNCLEVTLNNAVPNDPSAANRIMVRNLITHTRNICIALNTLFEAGVKTAVEELDELMALDPNLNFNFTRDIGLKPDNLLSEITTIQELEQPSSHGPLVDASQHSSRIVALIQTLLSDSPQYIDWSQEHPMALVLVRERSTAKKISGILQTQREINDKGLKVTHLVGHGGGSGDGEGMAVQQQRKILHDIKRHKYQIVIATSVAEEGIDIPECELVITMNLPSTVTALVQMRGRARKANSKFMVLCNDQLENDQLSELMKKEDNMIKAANFLFDSQNRPGAKEN